MTTEQLRAAGFAVSAEACRLLGGYVAELLHENERLNLTACRDAAEFWRVHICDCLALAAHLRAQPSEVREMRVLDLGAGGGLPGIPLACACPDAQVTLLEATGKKVAALERIIARVGLGNVNAAHGRAEVLAHDPQYREQFDLVTARAVAELPALLELAAGFVKAGGTCWFFKSRPQAEREIPAARSAAARCALDYAGTELYRVPAEADRRALVRYRKTASLSTDLPRRTGRATTRPL